MGMGGNGNNDSVPAHFHGEVSSALYVSSLVNKHRPILMCFLVLIISRWKPLWEKT